MLGLNKSCQLYPDKNTSAAMMPTSNPLNIGLFENLGRSTESGSLEHELLQVYFQYFHPACLVIDGTEVMGQYYNHKYLHEDLSSKVSLLRHAMMFVAFGVSSCPSSFVSTVFKT
jgi:hypothetical protein